MPKKHLKREKKRGIGRLEVIIKVNKRFRKYNMNLQKVRKTPAEDMEDWDIVLGRREAALSLSPWSWNRSEQGKKAPGGNMPGAGWRDR